MIITIPCPTCGAGERDIFRFDLFEWQCSKCHEWVKPLQGLECPKCHYMIIARREIPH